MMQSGLLIFAARVQSALEKDYELRGLMLQSTSQYCEDYIHDYFVDCTGNSCDVSCCAFKLANDIQLGKASEYVSNNS